MANEAKNELWDKALEQMEITGWHYEFCMWEDVPAYRYVTEDKRIYAVVSDTAVIIGVMFVAELFRRQRTDKDPYFALARAARSADILTGSFKDIDIHLAVNL